MTTPTKLLSWADRILSTSVLDPLVKSEKPPEGFTPIPGSKKGGFHKRVGNHYETWYPGAGHKHLHHDEGNLLQFDGMSSNTHVHVDKTGRSVHSSLVRREFGKGREQYVVHQETRSRAGDFVKEKHKIFDSEGEANDHLHSIMPKAAHTGEGPTVSLRQLKSHANDRREEVFEKLRSVLSTFGGVLRASGGEKPGSLTFSVQQPITEAGERLLRRHIAKALPELEAVTVEGRNVHVVDPELRLRQNALAEAQK